MLSFYKLQWLNGSKLKKVLVNRRVGQKVSPVYWFLNISKRANKAIFVRLKIMHVVLHHDIITELNLLAQCMHFKLLVKYSIQLITCNICDVILDINL